MPPVSHLLTLVCTMMPTMTLQMRPATLMANRCFSSRQYVRLASIRCETAGPRNSQAREVDTIFPRQKRSGPLMQTMWMPSETSQVKSVRLQMSRMTGICRYIAEAIVVSVMI